MIKVFSITLASDTSSIGFPSSCSAVTTIGDLFGLAVVLFVFTVIIALSVLHVGDDNSP